MERRQQALRRRRRRPEIEASDSRLKHFVAFWGFLLIRSPVVRINQALQL